MNFIIFVLSKFRPKLLAAFSWTWRLYITDKIIICGDGNTKNDALNAARNGHYN